MSVLARTLRHWQIRALQRVDAQTLETLSARRLGPQARRMAAKVPAYASILAERGVDAKALQSPEAVLALCPVLGKEDLFGRFPLRELCVGGSLASLASVLTSSGHGSRFAFGLSTAGQNRMATKAVDLGLEYAFQTDSHRTLLINALPMGVRFSASAVTIAETSVREDMVAALLAHVAPTFEQTILVLDPLFAKRLLDHLRDSEVDPGQLKIHVILGEETFGEHFRSYAAHRLGQDPDAWSRGFVGSSMGVGELGLNLFFETRETVRLRQLAQRQPSLLGGCIGPWPGDVPPIIFVFDPRRIYVEITETDDAGFGALTISTLDRALMLPLLRYKTGDRAKRLCGRSLRRMLDAAGLQDVSLPRLPMIALAGRERDRLPDGRQLLDFKDALYACAELADQLSGAFRIELDGAACRIHVQMREGAHADPIGLAEALAAALPPSPGPRDDRVVAWEYAEFPFARSLDYERKLDYLGPA